MIVVIAFVIWFVMAIGVLAIGITPLRIADTSRATLYEAVSHGMGWLTLCLGGWFFIPLFETSFKDFDTELPAITKMLITISH